MGAEQKDLGTLWRSHRKLETVAALILIIRSLSWMPLFLYLLFTTDCVQAIKYLPAEGFGAKFFGIFGNGRVQSFINARTLTPADMRKPKLVNLTLWKFLVLKNLSYGKTSSSSMRMVSDKDLRAYTGRYFNFSFGLIWALWALIQAKMSPIDFDYLVSFLRYNEYKKQKEKGGSLARSYL